MPKNIMRWLMLAVVLMLMPSVLVTAQENAPLIVYANGELLIGDASSLQPFTQCQPEEVILPPLTMLPDGRGFILMTQPARITELISDIGGLGGVILPNNLYYCDLASRSLTLISVQPDTFSFFDEVELDNGISHGIITPSPDGRRIAWSELSFPDYVTQLVVHDLETGIVERREITLPESFGVPVPPLTLWLEDGIGTIAYTFDDETFEAITLLEYYALTAEGAFTPDAPLSLELSREGEMSDFIDAFLPVAYQGGVWLALRFNMAGWVLVDVRTATTLTPDGLPFQVASNNRDGSLALTLDLTPNYESNWQANGTNTRDFFNYPQGRIALSGDGQRVAFAGGVLEIWDSRDDSVVEVPNTEGFADDFSATVLWGGVTWRWSEGATSAMSAPTTCEGTQTSRLMPNTLARVAEPTIPNNVRSAPSTSAQLVGQIPGGATFTVLSLPTCADGYAWYQIQYGELVGWTAEGTADTYWLEPLNP